VLTNVRIMITNVHEAGDLTIRQFHRFIYLLNSNKKCVTNNTLQKARQQGSVEKLPSK